MSAIADDPGFARRLDTYLRQSLIWLHDYAGAGGKRIDRTFPYEWSFNLARAIGRFALASGAADLWRPLADFDRDRDAERCVIQYLDALTRDLIAKGSGARGRAERGDEGSRLQAREILYSMLQSVSIFPDGRDHTKIDIRGDLAGIIAVCRQQKGRPKAAVNEAIAGLSGRSAASGHMLLDH